MDMTLFPDALRGLHRGDFSKLEPLFIDKPEAGKRAQIIEWLEEGRFLNEPAALAEALTCACFLGRTNVAEHLLIHGVDPSGGNGTGLNAIHWAANRGQVESVRLLLKWDVPLQTRSMYGGNVVDTAIWSAVNEPRPGQLDIIKDLLAAGGRPTGELQPTGHSDVDALLCPFRSE